MKKVPLSYFFLRRCVPTWAMAFSFLRFLDHIQRLTTVGKTTLDEWSARRRDLYLTTHNTHNRKNIHAPVGIRTHDPSRRAAADLLLRPRGHWNRLVCHIGITFWVTDWLNILLQTCTQYLPWNVSNHTPNYTKLCNTKLYSHYLLHRELQIWVIPFILSENWQGQEVGITFRVSEFYAQISTFVCVYWISRT